MAMEPITEYQDFKEKTESDEKVIVKIFAGWCPDCTAMNMFIDPIMEEYNSVEWYELNRDDIPEAAQENDVMGIPSLLVFQNGEKLAHLHSANAKTPESVTEFLKENV